MGTDTEEDNLLGCDAYPDNDSDFGVDDIGSYREALLYKASIPSDTRRKYRMVGLSEQQLENLDNPSEMPKLSFIDKYRLKNQLKKARDKVNSQQRSREDILEAIKQLSEVIYLKDPDGNEIPMTEIENMSDEEIAEGFKLILDEFEKMVKGH